ncbi:MAG: hypothetical protein QOK10_2150 [Pseudonocardiales bacterium]|jgi:hypothetical protein|nr:hypothetical protein [Pseudonocardiales bacterium]
MTDMSTGVGQPQAPSSPIPRRIRRPGWLDLRLIAGVVLVLTAILAGASIMSSADDRHPVWALRHDVAVGTVLQSEDLSVVQVQLGRSAADYLPATEAVAGRTVQHALRAGELVPRAEVQDPQAGVAVTIPVRPENSPRIARGDRVIFWVSTSTCKGLVLMSGVTVQDVRTSAAGALSSGAANVVMVRLPTSEASRVVGVLDLEGVVIRAGVLSAGERAGPASQQFGQCGRSGR